MTETSVGSTAAPATPPSGLLDADSHLLPSSDVFVRLLGPDDGAAMQRWAATFATTEHPSLPADADLAARRRDVWSRKNWRGMADETVGDRLAALDLMGIDRQLVFAPVCWPTLHGDDERSTAGNRAYNDWALDWADGQDRVRPVVLLGLADPEVALAEARRLVDRGARAVEVPFARPPGGRSPADPVWDPLWTVLAAGGLPVLLHVGGGGIGTMGGPGRSMLDLAWGGAPLLRPPLGPDAVHPYRGDPRGEVGPFDVVLQHVPAEVFVTALVLGGVFERHPALRVGVVELGAQWVSGWVERLDQAWEGAAGLFRFKQSRLSRRPSEIVRDHVRVTPAYGEPVGTYLARDGLDEVYAFATDFPHAEGGVDPVDHYRRSFIRSGTAPSAIDAFFRRNGLALLPP